MVPLRPTARLRCLSSVVRRYPCRMRPKKTLYAAVGFLAVKVGSGIARRRLRKALHRA